MGLHGYMHFRHGDSSRPESEFHETLEVVSDRMYSGVVEGEAGDGAADECCIETGLWDPNQVGIPGWVRADVIEDGKCCRREVAGAGSDELMGRPSERVRELVTESGEQIVEAAMGYLPIE